MGVLIGKGGIYGQVTILRFVFAIHYCSAWRNSWGLALLFELFEDLSLVMKRFLQLKATLELHRNCRIDIFRHCWWINPLHHILQVPGVVSMWLTVNPLTIFPGGGGNNLNSPLPLPLTYYLCYMFQMAVPAVMCVFSTCIPYLPSLLFFCHFRPSGSNRPCASQWTMQISLWQFLTRRFTTAWKEEWNELCWRAALSWIIFFFFWFASNKTLFLWTKFYQ